MVEKKKKAPTSVDVAREAGVSQATVSRVFNSESRESVKAELREHVLEVAKKIGYKPNLVARGMISGKTNVIALVTGEAPGPFYSRVINLFVQHIQKMGKQCLVFQVPRQGELQPIISRVIQFHVEAIIITSSAMNDGIEEACDSEGIPVVLFNKIIPGIDMNTVCVNSFDSGMKAAKLFIENGHKKIGYIKYVRKSQEENEKYMGFSSEFRRIGIHSFQEKSSRYTYEDGYEAGKEMLSQEDRPTAIFCTSDVIAIGVIDAAREEFGLKVPEDLSVIGCDSVGMGALKSYNLTSLQQPVEEMVEKVIVFIANIGKNDFDGVKVEMFEPELIDRGSVGKI